MKVFLDEFFFSIWMKVYLTLANTSIFSSIAETATFVSRSYVLHERKFLLTTHAS